MAQISQPWDGTVVGDATRAPYSADEWDDMFEALFDSGRSGHEDFGVVAGYWNELLVAGVASPLRIDAGAALVHGKWYVNTTPATLIIPLPTVLTRYDYVVLRCNWTVVTVPPTIQTIRIALHQGIEGAGAPPLLTQTDGTEWEIPLAIISTTVGGVITVTDDRHYIQSQHQQHKALSMGAAFVNGAGVSQQRSGWTYENVVLVWDTAGPTSRAYWQIDISDWDEYHPLQVTIKTLPALVGVGDGNPSVWKLYASQFPDHCDVSGDYSIGLIYTETATGSASRHVEDISFTILYVEGYRNHRILHLALERDYNNVGDTSTDDWVTVDGKLEYRA